MQRTSWSLHITATRTHHLAKTALFLKDNPFIQYARWNGVTIHFHYTEPHQIPCMIRDEQLHVLWPLCFHRNQGGFPLQSCRLCTTVRPTFHCSARDQIKGARRASGEDDLFTGRYKLAKHQ